MCVARLGGGKGKQNERGHRNERTLSTSLGL